MNMMNNDNNHRNENLKLAVKRMDKYIRLPNRSDWKIHKTDVLQTGRVVCYIRSKPSFFLLPDHISTIKSRAITVTRHGYMVIYEDDDRGIVVDLTRASHVISNTDRFKSKKHEEYFRGHIKIRLPRGNIHLFVKDEAVHKWNCAVIHAAGLKNRKTSASTLSPDEGVLLMTALEEMTMETDTAYSDSENSVKSESPDFTDSQTTVVERAQPQPQPISVRSLCEKLEKKLQVKTKDQVLAEQQEQIRSKMYVSEVYFDQKEEPNFTEEAVVVLMPTDEKERKALAEQKEWWTRSLRC